MSDYVEGFGDAGRKKDRLARFNTAAIVFISIAAIIIQVTVFRFARYLSYLDLALLVTVYFSLMKRSPVAGVLFGAGIGLAQDSLARGLIGMYGIVKTLVGYFAASVGQRFDVDSSMVRLALAFFFYFFHQFFYWVLARALLGQAVGFDLESNLVKGVLNAVVAVPLFRTLDKLKVTG